MNRRTVENVIGFLLTVAVILAAAWGVLAIIGCGNSTGPVPTIRTTSTPGAGACAIEWEFFAPSPTTASLSATIGGQGGAVWDNGSEPLATADVRWQGGPAALTGPIGLTWTIGGRAGGHTLATCGAAWSGPAY